jgi:hypothetical protein
MMPSPKISLVPTANRFTKTSRGTTDARIRGSR